jgi:hypothetical protein
MCCVADFSYFTEDDCVMVYVSHNVGLDRCHCYTA